MRVAHVLHTVRDDFSAGQRIEHAVVAHGDAVIHGDCVELFGDAAGSLNLLGHQLAHVFEVHVTRHELRKAVGDSDDGFAELFVRHASGAPEGPGAGHVAAVGRCARAIRRH